MTLLGRWVGVEIFSMAPMANCSVTTVELDPDNGMLRVHGQDKGQVQEVLYQAKVF